MHGFTCLHISSKRFSDPALNFSCTLHCAFWKSKLQGDLQIEIGDFSLMCLCLNIKDMHTKYFAKEKRKNQAAEQLPAVWKGALTNRVQNQSFLSVQPRHPVLIFFCYFNGQGGKNHKIMESTCLLKILRGVKTICNL